MNEHNITYSCECSDGDVVVGADEHDYIYEKCPYCKAFGMLQSTPSDHNELWNLVKIMGVLFNDNNN